jgi:hypothetical protein
MTTKVTNPRVTNPGFALTTGTTNDNKGN